MDIAAELESRLMSTTQTEESMDNPWLGAQGTTMTSHSLDTPVMLESEKDPPITVEERSETDPELPLLRRYDQRVEDAALEQRHLTKQLRTLAQELRRTRSQAAADRAMEQSTTEPANWTARELRLVQDAVDRWKRLKTYAMAEELLTGAVNVREANVIA